MARGDRREPIVVDDVDRAAFAGLLGELVERTGWALFAWVLMGNHDHLLFKTPEPNLVAGMKWLQNTWTKRFNARHRLWGHARDHGAAQARRVIRSGLALAGLAPSDLPALPKGDWRKRGIGRLVRRRTTVPVAWLAGELAMGDPKRAANLLRENPNPRWGRNWKIAAKLIRELDAASGNVD